VGERERVVGRRGGGGEAPEGVRGERIRIDSYGPLLRPILVDREIRSHF
jgi:hypothetical protein